MSRTRTWVLIADGARARFYAFRDRTLIPALDHDLAAPTRSGVSAIASDRPGRGFAAAGGGRHALQPPTDWKTHEKSLLARSIADEIRRAEARRDFDRLVVIAPPAMLGILRASLGKRLSALVAVEIGQDLTHLTPAELADHLSGLLPG